MDFLIKPWAHQLEAITRAAPLNSFGLFFEQGTGKTSTTINILRVHFQNKKRVLRTIIIGPPIVVNNWRDEWAMHSKIPKSEIIPLVGSGAKRLSTFMQNAYTGAKFSEAISHPKIFITNYESLLMKNLFQAFIDWMPEALVFDECHRLKNYKSQRAKLADALANPVKSPRPFVYVLSGTPILNSPLDIFQQFVVLDGGKTFGQNFFQFRGRYFRDRNSGMPKERYFPKWEVMTKEKDGFDALADINRLLFSRSMRVEKKDCLDLPPEIHQVVKVGMSPEQAKLYKEMKNDFITFLGDKACTATIAITKALRLMQISSGFISLTSTTLSSETVSNENAKGIGAPIFDIPTFEGGNGNEVTHLDDTPKQEALKTMLEDLTVNHKVLVWAVWKENYAQIRKVCDELGVSYVEVHGGVSAAKKQENITKFKTDPKCKVFIGHPGSGGIGINLVVAPYSIFYSRTFSLEHWLQARARNHRGGSEIHEKITHYDLVCENTIDELVVSKLASKIEISDKILGDLSLEMQAQEL